MEDDPGRFNVLEFRGATVIVDDCHNASALTALTAALAQFPAELRTIVYSAGDRRMDRDIIRQGELLAASFDRVILYEDASAVGRARGELARLFRQGFAGCPREIVVDEIGDHGQAIEWALDQAGPGELIVIQTEDEGIEPTLEIIRNITTPAAHEDTECPEQPHERAPVARSHQL